MNALLESLRQTGRDLVAKRLWPVAVLLLVALIAIPMMIGSSSGDAVAPDPVAAAPGAAGAAPAATPATGETTTTKTKPVKEKSGGRLDDPFFDPPAPPDEAGAGAGAGSGGGARAVAKSPTGEAAPRSGAASPSTTGTANATPADPPAASRATTPATPRRRATPAPAATPLTSSYLRTVVRINGADRGKALPISRLTPLGGVTDPAAVFLGVAKVGARYAVFLLGPHATSRGDATCKRDGGCRMFGLRAGQTQVVTVRRPSGSVQRFTLRVEAIRTVSTSAARARAARARIHPDGREVVRDLRRNAVSAAVLRTVRYDARAGLLRAAPAGAVKNAAE